MVKYVLSIRPEYLGSFSPEAMVQAVLKLGDLHVIEGAGRRTITVEAPYDMSEELQFRIPQVTIRVYRPLGLLKSSA